MAPSCRVKVSQGCDGALALCKVVLVSVRGADYLPSQIESLARKYTKGIIIKGMKGERGVTSLVKPVSNGVHCLLSVLVVSIAIESIHV